MTKFSEEDDALLQELGVEVETKKAAKRTPREERIIAGFEEIQRFVEEHGHLPQHGEDKDIFERLYAVRLDRMRELEECRTLLDPFDTEGFLVSAAPTGFAEEGEDFDDDALLAELGVEAELSDITELRHVRSSADKKAAEEIANRQKCEDFAQFKPVFEAVRHELDTGVRVTRPFERKSEIKQGSLFIVGGQMAYVAEVGELFKTDQGMTDARLRVIYDNGTESDLLMRSLQRALHKDDAGRRITDPSAGPLFSGEAEADDLASGTIYVLRSKSDHPVVAENRDILHKIGVTGGDVKKRIANAKVEATYLLADVEVVAEYKLYNINRTRLENLVHRFFSKAQLDIQISDRFGNPVSPREWFLVPLFVIDEVVEKVKEGTLGDYEYSIEDAALVKL